MANYKSNQNPQKPVPEVKEEGWRKDKEAEITDPEFEKSQSDSNKHEL